MSMPIPPELLDLFDEPALGHVSYTSDSGQIVTSRCGSTTTTTA